MNAASFARLAAMVALAGVLLVGCGPLGPNETPSAPSGIRGTVVLGPTCPVESSPGANAPVPCLTPYAARLVILNDENVSVATVNSGADGRFEVTLPPGDYVVEPQIGDPYPIAQPLPVTVAAGQYIEVQINYDTGIR